MTNITAADVKKLRELTGSGMMDCKKALSESGGDMDKAIEGLRKKGQKVAAKRSDRESLEGVVLAKTQGNIGVIVSLNCETDFVAKNDNFINLADQITTIALGCNTKDSLMAANLGEGTISDKLVEQTGVIGEKIEIGNFERIKAPSVGAYTHNGNRIASLVAFSSERIDEDVKKSIAMQVVAMSPVAVDEDNIPKDILQKELEIAREQVRQEGKPDEMVEKIAQGKINKFIKENTLMNQMFIKQDKVSVKDYVASVAEDVLILEFKRVSLD